MKNKHNQSETTFYSARGIMFMVIAVLLFATLALIGMYHLGVINIPSFLTDFLGNKEEVPPAPPAANIAPETGTVEHIEALPRDEYAAALVDISFPEEFYQSYTVTVSSDKAKHVTDYVAIYQNGNWWVQTQENGAIMSTTVFKNGTLQISNNAENSFITSPSSTVPFAEYSGYTSLKELVGIINALTSGETVEYGGGIADYSLSFTQARGTNENIFTFDFSRKDGFSERYTFGLESATILSITKSDTNGNVFYQMNMKDSKNDLKDVNTESLIKLK